MKHLLFFLLFIQTTFSFAQNPTLGAVGDESDFPGTSFCSTVSLTNVGDTGYGPYLRIVIPEGVSVDSAQLFGSAVSVTTVGAFPAAPNNELIDPVTGETVTGNEGEVMYIVQPPIGSVVEGAVSLDMIICFSIDPDAPVNVDIPVTITPIYQYGDTPTGDNGPITGTPISFNVTPILVEFEKLNSAPENERPPGDDWPVTYTLIARVAQSNTLTNINVNDVFPAGFVINPGSAMVTGGTNCSVATESPLNVTCDSVDGTNGNDIVITYSGYFDDILDEMVCDAQSLVNTATFDADHMGSAIPQVSDSSQVSVEHMSVQKSANPQFASPGDVVTFTLNLQLSEFAEASSIVITDTLPDGYTYSGGSFTTTLAGVTATPNDNGDGSTDLVIDVTAPGNLVGGNPTITMTYQATIDQSYFNNEPVLANDDLVNVANSVYDLTAGASSCNEGSNASVTVEPIEVFKEIINPQSSYQPGETVTYRLTMEVPSGDTRDIVFTDFFPLPVFDVTTLDLTYGNDIRRADPPDTLNLVPTSIVADPGTNSLVITWPDVSTTDPQFISVDIDIDITTDPFADNLSLANLFVVDTENSQSEGSTGVTPVLVQVRAPELALTKGVLSSDQGTIAPPPATLPVDGDVIDVDAGDTVTFRLTIENLGGATANQVTITDPTPIGFSSCSVAAITDGNGGALTATGDLNAGLVLDNSIAPNDDNPAGGGAPYGADTAFVDIACVVDSTVEWGESYTNTASVEYRAQVGAVPFPIISEVAQITIAEPTVTKTRLSVSPDVDGDAGTATVGESIEYQVVITLPEGVGSNSVLTDVLDGGLTFLSFDGLVGSADVSTSPNNLAMVLANATGLGSASASFDFGTITNANTDNNTAETITVTYTVLVNDANPIQNGVNRNNNARFNTDSTTDSDQAENTLIREPNLTINKTPSPTNADAGDTVTYTVVLQNTGTSPAFDVVVTDAVSDPDLSLVAGSVTTSSGSVDVGNTGGDTSIEVSVVSIPVGGSVTITYQAVISATVESGDTVSNTASVSSSSLPGGDPNERTYGPTDSTADVSISEAQIIKAVLPATSTEQSDGTVALGNDATLVDLTIGEEVTFRITATLAEGVSSNVVITDTLPGNATGQMEVVSASIFNVGASLTPANPNPPANIGPANVVSFDFGSVTNAPDGVENDDDRIVIDVVAVVTDDLVNAGIETLTNNVLIQYGSGLDQSGSADVEVVEPVMDVSKTGSVTTADAGDVITYTIQITNNAPASSARAFEVSLIDAIPAGLAFNGNLSHDAGLAPDGGTLMENAGVVSAFWTSFPLNETSTISFDVVVENTVNPEQVITNTANIDWTSMPGTPAEERSGMDANGHAITITASGLEKTVVDTSVAGTGTAVSGPENDVTIGEEVTYHITLTLPEGTSPNAVMVDQLPNSVAIMDVVSSRIVSVGGITGPGISVGLAGTASDSAPADGYNDVVTWNLGDLLNTPDGVSDANDQVVFEVIAVVVDEAVNQTLIDNVTNQATFTSGGSSVMATVDVDVVEPLLTVSKETVPNSITADAGDVLTYRLTIAHEANSTADAYNISVTDVLPDPGTSWINDTTVSGTCSNIVVDSSSDPSITFTADPLTTALGSCTIEYDVEVDVLVNPNETYQNTATANYSTAPGNGGEVRDSSDMSQTTFMTSSPAIMKMTAGSSLNDTDDNQHDMLVPDLAIGETIDFTLTVIFPEGTTTNAVVQDLLPVAADGGVLEVVGATIDSIGALTTTLPGTPVLSDRDADANSINDTVTFDFGTVTNQPDGVVDANDQLVITVTALVVDDPLNVDGLLLTNNATFTYGPGTVLNDDASVELVEPNLGMSKSFGQVNNLVVPITLTINNTGGTAAAYDIVLEDVFDTNIWDASGFSAVTIPTGFLYSDAAGPGVDQHTVTISSNGALTAPDNSVEPNEVIVFTFNATLRNDVTLPTTIPNTANLTDASSLPGDDPNERDFDPISGNDDLLLPELDVDKAANLQVDADSSTNASPGDTIRYTITIENTGDGDATLVMLSDTPDANGTLVVGSVTTSQGTVTTGNTAGDTDVAVDVGTISAGSTVTVTYDVVVNDPLPTGVEQLVNQALVESQELPDEDSNDPDTLPDDDPTIVPIVAAPDLEVTKSDGGVTVEPGNSLDFTITYSNVGNQDATGVVITETVPDYTTFNPAGTPDAWVCSPDNNAGSTCTLSVGNLNALDSGSAVFSLTVDSTFPDGVDSLSNSVSIADDGNNGPDPDPDNNDGSDTTPVNATPDLTLSKSDGDASVVPGGVIVYTLSYENVGNQTATGVMISETVPAMTTFVPGSSTAGWVCVPDNSAGSNCSFSLPDLNPSDSGSVTFAVQVDATIPAGVTEIANNASIADDGSNGTDPTPGNNGDGDTTPVNAAPDMALIKSDGVSQVEPGDTLAYVLTYENVGDQGATGVVITETVPLQTTFLPASSTAGWVCVPDNSENSVCTFSVGAVPAGTSGMVTFAVLVDNPLDANTTQISNTASVADDGSNGTDPNPGNNSGTDNDAVGDAAVDLVVTKTDGDVTAVPGGVVVYDINYSNQGNLGSTGVILIETVPLNSVFNPGSSTAGWDCQPDNSAGSTCTLAIGALAGGGTAGTAQFAVTVDNPLPTGVTQLGNHVNIRDDGNNGPDLNPGDNAGNDNTPVDAAPDLSISKSHQQSPVMPGDVIVYDVVYDNVGNQDATGVVITETVPVHTAFNAAQSTAGWNCVPDGSAGSTCTFTVGNVPVNDGPQTIQFAVMIFDTINSAKEEIINVISINDDGSNGPDPDPDNNTGGENTPVTAAPDMYISKTDGDINASPGDTVTFTIMYGNSGNQDATGVVITETVPDNSTHNPGASNVVWNCVPDNTAGSTCTYAVGNVAAGASDQVTFAVDVDDPLPAGVSEMINTVIIEDDGSNGTDPDPDNNSGSDTTPLTLEPPVGQKTGEFDPDNERIIRWTIVWFNPNNERDLPVFIFDAIPDGTAFVGNASCTATGTSTCTTPVYNAGLNRIEVDAILGPDFGAPSNSTPDQLDNEIIITFDVRVIGLGSPEYRNQAFAHWDHDNDGDPGNDAGDGQDPIPTDDPVTQDPNDPTLLIGRVYPIPTLNQFMLILLMLMMAGMGMRQVRFLRQ